ncbi:MAG: choline-sulfatase [Chlamydiales bacterium]|jgi:choline-sulfatase
MISRSRSLALGLTLLACSPADSAPGPRNVLLVTLDTTRADHLGAYGMRAGVTPCLDQLAKEGVVFEQALTPVPITLPAHSSLLTGMYPPFHGVHDNGTFYLPAGCRTLAEVLSGQGFVTGAFVAAQVLARRHGLYQGFDEYADVATAAGGGAGHGPELRGEQVVDRALDWLEGVGGQRFFAWVHLFDPHKPYAAPAGFQERFAEDPYLAEIAYADSQVARLRQHLAAHDQLDDTLILVTSDHGEGCGEHGEVTHAVLAYQGTLHVPLIWRHPSLTAGARLASPVSLVDVMPSVLELLGVPVPDLHGVDIFDEAAREAQRELYFESEFALRNFGWSALRGMRTGASKFIAAPRSELYDLDADPEETANLLDGDAQRAAGLLRRLERLRASLAEGRPTDGGELELSAEDARALEALGYASAPEEGEQGELVDPKDRIEYAGRVLGLWMTFVVGEHEQARRDAELILAENPRVLLAWSTLAAITMQTAEAQLAAGETERSRVGFTEGLAQLERALDIDPERIDCLMQKGAALRRLERPEEAAAAFARCIEVQPEYALPHRLLGRLMERAGELELAIQSYERFVELCRTPGRALDDTRARLERMR